MHSNLTVEPLSKKLPLSTCGITEMLSTLHRTPTAAQDCGFDVRMAQTRFEHLAANLLVRQMYERRGYDTTTFGSTFGASNRTTLIAWNNGRAIATMTLGCDSATGLLADTLYRREIDLVRSADRVVCEATALAAHPEFSTTDMLAALFNSALRHSQDVGGPATP